MPKVSLIILTYNSSNYIVNLLKSITSLTEDLEILIVDNASMDDTLVLVKSSELKVDKVLKLPKNVGFAAGINSGVKSASGEYLLFINPDSVFEHGQIKEMVSVFEKNADAGVVGGKMLDDSGKPEKSAGRVFNLFETLLLVLGLDEALGARYSPEKIKKVGFVSGGFMMVKKAVFEKLKGFDENFFMYLEDMEFCYRAKKEGFNTYFTPDVVISHAGQGSSNREFAILNIYKGILYFYKKHKSIFEVKFIKLMLKLKAGSVYLLGRIINNSYYTYTYKKALEEIY
jgi:GT2 family glycosyltransferase